MQQILEHQYYYKAFKIVERITSHTLSTFLVDIYIWKREEKTELI